MDVAPRPACRTGRRALAGTALLVAAALLAGVPTSRAGADERSPRRYTDEGLRRRVLEKGCAYLASKQDRPEGSYSYKKVSQVVAVTALCTLALMAQGSTDGRGPYGAEVKRGIDFLLKLVEQPQPGRPANEDGYFYHPMDSDSRMHGQGYATLLLATALGTSNGDRYWQIRRVLEKAVKCIEQAQTETGGFGYEPISTKDHEGSVTVTVAQGLRAARDAGILVNDNVVRKGLHYLKRSQRDERRPGAEAGPFDGSFTYSLHHEKTSYALTAAALSSFFLYGKYTDDADHTIERGLRFLMGREGLREVMDTREWWSYGHFYAAWACWQKDGDRWDDAPGNFWGRWHRIVYPAIIAQQTDEGSWEDRDDRYEFGPLLPTAFAILTLSIPDEILPIFQR